MLLYELRSPVELKFGGSLTEEEMSRCERQTELNSPRWTPYPWRSPFVENICGKFVVHMEGGESAIRSGLVSGSLTDVSDTVSRNSEIPPSGIPTSDVLNSESGITNTENPISDIPISDIPISDIPISDIPISDIPISDIPISDISTPGTSNTQIPITPNLISPNLMDVVCDGGVKESTPKHHMSPFYASCLSDRQLTVDPRLSSVCFSTDTPFGRQQEILHIDGHITARCTPGLPRSLIFKGAKGMDSVNRLIRDLFLDQQKTFPLVHMGVISSCMGVRLQTSECCYLENRVMAGTGVMRGGWMTVETRAPDQCNVVRLSVRDWTGLLLPAFIPISNDVVITGKGSVVHRFSWAGLPWDEQVEREILGACESVVAAIASVC